MVNENASYRDPPDIVPEGSGLAMNDYQSFSNLSGESSAKE